MKLTIDLSLKQLSLKLPQLSITTDREKKEGKSLFTSLKEKAAKAKESFDEKVDDFVKKETPTDENAQA